MRDYSLYLFDFDNTLFDSRPRVIPVLKAVLAEKGMEYDPSRLSEYLNTDLDAVYGGSTPEETRRIAGICESVLASLGDAAVPFPDAIPVLRELKRRGKLIGVVSGSSREEIMRYFDANGIGDIPDTVVGWYQTERHKPYPDPIALAFSQFDVPKEDTVYVGDSTNDSGASEAFGIDCIIVNRPDGTGHDGIPCTYEIRSLDELLGSRGGPPPCEQFPTESITY